MKNANLLRYPPPASLRRTGLYVALLVISGALHLNVFDQPGQCVFSSDLLEFKEILDFLGKHHVAGEFHLAAHKSLDGVNLFVHDAKPCVARHGQGHGG